VWQEFKKLKLMSPCLLRRPCTELHRLDSRAPMEERTRTNWNITEATKILDEDHYGLEKPKERILEYLAVQA